MFVAKEKAIYAALNMMKSREKTYIGFIWVPALKENALREELSVFATTEF
jgi:pyrrolidone-carboxylate peptidase